jgi:hypothetical protein
MTRIASLRPEFGHYVPEKIEEGVLYISKRYATACHRCCCGCGSEIVTPLNPAKWQLTEHDGSVSLSPSIGNWNIPCRSHYIIHRNRVRWAGAMSAASIARVRELDRVDAQAYRAVVPSRPWFVEIPRRTWRVSIAWIKGFWQ